MTDPIPRQIDKRVRREIAALTQPWRLIKKRDHYFLKIAGKPLVCVGSNCSKNSDWQINKTLQDIRKA